MIRNLKVLLAAALALTALGAIAASAHAADEFNCSATPCRGTLKPDGTGKTAHHVFIVENTAKTESVSFTCETLSGEGSIATSPATQVTAENLNYANCTANGSSGVVVDMNGCTYSFKALNGTTDGAEVTVACPTGKQIEITYNGCVMDVKGGFSATGIGYSTVGVSPNREITATTSNVVIPEAQIKATGTKAQCLINPEQALLGTYTTGNTLVTGETAGGEMKDAWYA